MDVSKPGMKGEDGGFVPTQLSTACRQHVMRGNTFPIIYRLFTVVYKYVIVTKNVNACIVVNSYCSRRQCVHVNLKEGSVITSRCYIGFCTQMRMLVRSKKKKKGNP